VGVASHDRPPTYKKVLNIMRPNQAAPINRAPMRKEVAVFK